MPIATITNRAQDAQIKLADLARRLPGWASSRSGVYTRAQERFEHIVQGGDLVNLAPVLPGQPLVGVQGSDHSRLRALGATDVGGKFLMPAGLDEEDIWKFKQWFPRATPDLEARGSSWELTRDGRPTNGFILPEDTFRGADSTATSLLMGAFPVLFALIYAMYPIPVVGPLLVWLVCVPVLLAHAYALYQAEGSSTLVKLVALAGAVPWLLLGERSIQLNWQTLLGMAAVVALLTAFGGPGGKTQVFSAFARFKHALAFVGVVAGLNAALGFLPAGFDWLKPLGLFAVACVYPLYYTYGNFTARTAELEIQSKLRAGSTAGEGSLMGKLAPVRLEQIRFAARDTTPLICLGTAQGILAKADLAIAPDPSQVMALSLRDLSTHLHVFGETGSGKTSSILRPLALRLALLPEKIGMILSDGKGAMVADMRPLLDVVIEPGTKYAPFQGLDSEQVANAFAESHGEDLSTAGADNASFWVKGAGLFHTFALAILQALVEHEKLEKESARSRLASVELQMEDLVAARIEATRAQLDTAEIQSRLDGLARVAQTLATIINEPRRHRWTPAGYNRLKDVLATPVMYQGGVMGPNEKSKALFDYLGYLDLSQPEVQTVHMRRLHAEHPEGIHPKLLGDSSLLMRAIHYFNITWPGIHEEGRSSFLGNVNQDILQFLTTDKLHGSMMDGVAAKDEAWAETEEGVDVLQVVYGKRLGINLPASQYGAIGKLVAKLVKSRIFGEIRRRSQAHGEAWREKTGQTIVMDMVDECQDMVSNMEINLVATARSMGLFFVYATQSIESLDTVMRSDDAKRRYLNNFLSLCSFKASAGTYKFFQAKAGPVKKKKLTTTVQSTIDYTRSIDTYYNTIYADPNHPSASALRDMERRGATRLQLVIQGLQHFIGLARKVPISELRDQNFIPVYASGEYVDGQVLEDTDFTTYLQTKGACVFILNRAEHTRIDFAHTSHIEAKDVKPFLDQHAQRSP